MKKETKVWLITLGSVLPDFEPNELICKKVFEIASRVFFEAKEILEQKS